MSTIWIRRMRRVTQVLFLIVIALLPWIDGFRLDLTEKQFVIAGRFFHVGQLYLLIIAFALFILLLALFARTMGRLFCGWLCFQTTWSEIGDAIVERLHKWKKMKTSSRRTKLLVTILMRLVVAVPLIWAFYTVLVSYFISPSILLSWLDQGPPMWFIVLGIKFSVFAFIDLLIIRHSFCHSICPYGLLQKVVQKNTVLKVTFNPDACIDCNLCDQACLMDLKPRQLTPRDSCISCQECVVACGVRAEKFREKGMSYGTENCLAMTFKPYNPSLKERFDSLSSGFAGLILLLSAILSWGIISDNGLDMTVRPAASAEVVNGDSDRFKSPYILEVRNRTTEEASLEFKVRCEEINATLEAAPAQVTVPGMETYQDVIFIISATGNVPEGRWPIWIDAYAEGEVIASVKTVFYNQHTQP